MSKGLFTSSEVAQLSGIGQSTLRSYVKFYNSHLKYVGKKYYVQNLSGDNFISFVRKNNKILADLTRMTNAESRFILENYLEDLLRNTEIIIIDENDLSTYSSLLKNWPGNVIIRDPNYSI